MLRNCRAQQVRTELPDTGGLYLVHSVFTEVKLLHRSRCPSHFDLPFPVLSILEHICFSVSLSYFVLLLISSDSVRKITFMGIHFFH